MQIPANSTFSNATEVYGPGDYFVSAMDGDQFWLMAGPYKTHDEALGAVCAVREIACDHDPRGCFYAWGTCRLDENCGRIGALNRNNLLPDLDAETDF
jgi:hypothetical protein